MIYNLTEIPRLSFFSLFPFFPLGQKSSCLLLCELGSYHSLSSPVYSLFLFTYNHKHITHTLDCLPSAIYCTTKSPTYVFASLCYPDIQSNSLSLSYTMSAFQDDSAYESEHEDLIPDVPRVRLLPSQRQ